MGILGIMEEEEEEEANPISHLVPQKHRASHLTAEAVLRLQLTSTTRGGQRSIRGMVGGGGQWAIRPETLDHLVTSFVFKTKVFFSFCDWGWNKVLFPVTCARFPHHRVS